MGATDMIHRRAEELQIGIEMLFQRAAKDRRFTNYLEVGTYRFQEFLHEGLIPPYIIEFCLQNNQRDIKMPVRQGAD